MSGLEVLGAAAAAAQLIDQGTQIAIFISDLYSKIRDAPESIRNQAVQVEQLVDISRLIEHNPSLQTSAVASTLRTCLAEARKLQDILSKFSVSAQDGKTKRLWKALDGVTKEKKINALFHDLEQQKSSLALSIQAVDSAVIHDNLPGISAQLASVMQQLTINAHVVQSPAPLQVLTEGHFLVPFARSPDFIGRDSYMKNLSARLEKEDNHNRVALVGLGGIGKSQIAIEYAYRFHEASPETSIYWVYAGNAARFEQDYLKIGRNAKLPGIEDLKQDTNQLIKDWLGNKNSGKWLMIIDNADDADLFFGARDHNDPSMPTRLSRFLPQCSNGSIFFTTRNKKAGVKFAAKNIVNLERMTATEAEGLLKSRIEEKDLDLDIVTELLELLEYIPLAVSQAAAYMAENSISISEYLQLYNESESSSIELLSEDFEELARDPETINPIAATWVISFEQIRNADMFAADLLSFMACLDRRGIPKELLPTTESPAKVVGALGLLKAYSLVTASEKNTMFNMHRLVHLITRSWLRANHEFDDRLSSCLLQVSKEFPNGSNAIYEFDKCALYLPHAQTVLVYEPLCPPTFAALISLAINVANHLKGQHRYDAGELRARQAMKWGEKLPGQDPVLILRALAILGSLLWLQGKDDDCDATSRRALDRFEEMSVDEQDKASARNAILEIHSVRTSVLRSQGRLDEAMESVRPILERYNMGIYDQGSMDEKIDNLRRIVYIYAGVGKFEEARELAERALELCINSRGKEDARTLNVMEAISHVYFRQKRYVEANELNVQLLNLRKAKFGDSHSDTLYTIGLIGMNYYAQGRYKEAELQFTTQLDLSHRIRDENHPFTIGAMIELANNYSKQQKYIECERLRLLITEFLQKKWGENSTKAIQSMIALSNTYCKQEKYTECEELERRVLELRREKLGQNHPDTILAMECLGDTLWKQQRYVECEDFQLKVLDSKLKELGGRHTNTIRTMENLIATLWEQGKYSKCEDLQLKVLDFRIKDKGDFHRGTIQLTYNLAWTYKKLRRHREAEGLRMRVEELDAERCKTEGSGAEESKKDWTWWDESDEEDLEAEGSGDDWLTIQEESDEEDLKAEGSRTDETEGAEMENLEVQGIKTNNQSS